MRYLTGPLGIIAATGFVIYSAVTAYHSAYGMTTEFKELAGWAASGIVLWECLGLLYVYQCWGNRTRGLAIAGFALVLAAGLYTMRLDLRFNVSGQSDLVASRKETTMKLDDTKSELKKARSDRDALRKTRRPTEAQLDEIERIEKRIDLLESKWDTTTIVSTPMPEAGWASRMLRGISSDEGWWTDALMVFGLLFWALARMIALPLAIASMQKASRKPAKAASAPRGMDVAAPPVPAVLAQQEPAESVSKVSLSEIPNNSPDDTPPPADVKPVAEAPAPPAEESPRAKVVLVTEGWKPEPKLTAAEKRRKVTEQRNAEAIKAVKAFAAERLALDAPLAQLVRSPKGFVESGGLPGDHVRKEFRKWARDTKKWRQFANLHDNPLGKAMNFVLETGRPTSGGGAVYAAVFKDEKMRAIG